MSVENYTKFIAEQARKSSVAGLRSGSITEAAEHFAKVIKKVDEAEKNGADASHDFHSKDDHKATVDKLASHLKKAGHRDVEVESSGKNDSYVYSTHSSGEGMTHSVSSTPHKDGGHEHEVYTSVSDNDH